MAHKKGGGTAKNLRDSNPKYLGTKLYAGETAQPGSIIVRQRGTKILPGANVGLGRDHTIYAIAAGKVEYKEKRKQNYDGSTSVRKIVSVVVI
jgi:large subunit ribosomal protein L27